MGDTSGAGPAPVAATIAGVDVEPGSYALYTVPGEQEWEIVINSSTNQWGIESQYSSVESQEVGRGSVPAEATDAPVETFEIRAEQQGDAAELVLEWENTRVRVPVQAR